MFQDRLVRAKEAMRIIGVGRSKYYEMVRGGELPPAIHVSGGIRGWMLSDLTRFIAQRIAASRPDTTSSGLADDDL